MFDENISMSISINEEVINPSIEKYVMILCFFSKYIIIFDSMIAPVKIPRENVIRNLKLFGLNMLL